MAWATDLELGTAYGLAIGCGFVLGAMISLFNAWRP